MLGIIGDITEEKQAEEALKQSAAEIHDLYNNAPCGYHSLDRDGLIVAINDTELTWLGYRREEIVGKKKFIDLLTPDSRQIFTHNFPRFKERGWVRDLEMELARKDGTILPVALSATAIKNAAGEYLASRSIVFDITERRRAAQTLQAAYDELEQQVQQRTVELAQANEGLRAQIAERKRAEALYRNLFEQSPDAVFILDLAGNHQQANRSAAEMLGYTHEEIQSLSMEHISANPDASARILARLIAGERIRPYERLFQRKNGSLVPVEIHVSLVRDEHGRPLHIQSIVRDITERKLAEDALRDSEESFRLLIDQAEDYSILMLDPEGRVLSWNSGAQRLKGYEAAEIIGQHFSCFYIEEDVRQGKPERLLKTAATQGSATVEGWHARKDGSRFWAAVTLTSLYAADGRLRGFSKIARDMTQYKRAEEEILKLNAELERRVRERTAELEVANTDLRQAKEDAEKANQAKSIFLSNMSHEIRTPLNAIFGFAQLLQRDPTLTPRQREEVATISRASEHLLALINDILEMARIEAGRIHLNVSVFSLQGLLDDLETMFRSRTEAKGLQLLVERDEGVPRHVIADENKVRQIFINLLDNAVKFTKRGGIGVRVRGEPVAAAAAAETDEVVIRLVIEVEDTGRGISDKDQARLFQPFQQAEGGPQAGGTGLGLTISRKFAQLMGGDISVVSQMGEGSCFHCQLLVRPTEGAIMDEPSKPRRVTGLRPGTGTVRVLVVDDNADNRALLWKLLLPVGFEVKEARDGREALAVFARWSPHVILMDMRMPNMDGYEATRRLKATEAGRAIPIIAVTASAFAEAEQAIRNAGVDAYIRKPFREERLFAALAESLNLHYVYDDEEEEAAAAPADALSVAALPEELAANLRAATITGDRIRLLTLLSEVVEYDPPLAAALRDMASKYAYEKLLALLEKEDL